RFTTMSSRQQNADPQLATGPPVSPQTEDYRPTGATASSLITRPPFSASLRFDEETRVLLRQRLLQISIVMGLCLLALIMYSLAGVGEAMAYGADPKLGAALQTVVLLYLVGTVVFLVRNPDVRLKTLRRLELVSVAVGMLFLGVLRLNSFLAFSPESPD